MQKKIYIHLFFYMFTCSIAAAAMQTNVPSVTPNTVLLTYAAPKFDPTPKKQKQHSTYILACDAGRHEVRVGIFAIKNKKPQLALEYRTPAQDIIPLSPERLTRFALFIKRILDDVKERAHISISDACIGAAGSTAPNRDLIDFIHAPFGVSAHELKKHTCLTNVLVVNDFETMALGVEAVDASEIITIFPGTTRSNGTKLVIGAGSGLGSSLLLWNEKLQAYMPSPLNYSFVEFNPQSELELKYNEFLKNTSNNAWGKVLGSSAGIVDIYNFLHKPQESLYQHAHYQEIFDKRDTDPACKAAVDMYMKLYIRLMRNAAYAQAPHAGLYITNDVAEQNPSLFTDSTFKTELLNTGDLSNAGNKYLHDYLQQIPVYLITTPNLKLYGAAFYGMSFFKN